MMCFVKSVQIQNLFSRKDPGAKAEARAALSEVSLDDPLSLEKAFATRHPALEIFITRCLMVFYPLLTETSLGVAQVERRSAA
jgi:hypothetical protein